MEIRIPPGVVKSATAAATAGRWWDMQWVRFVPDPEKIGGWTTFNDDPVTGIPRGLHQFLDPNTLPLVLAGTEKKLYAIGTNPETAPVNITPIRSTGTIDTDPIETTSGETEVTITDTSHGAIQGATVTFSGATAVGGITISGAYVITSVIDADSYTIEHSSAATSSATGGGASVTATYEINPGPANSAYSGGYGAGPYGEETYGDARTTASLILDGRRWSIDNYGNLGVAAYSDGGRVYDFQNGTDSTAQVISNSPTDARFAFVTEERFIFALRAGMVVAWPDQDDPTDWTPAATNTSNARTLATGSKLIAGSSIGGGQSLVWSDMAAYIFQYEPGNAFIYTSRRAGEQCGLAGPGAFCVADGVAFWASNAGFHIYVGGVQPIPNQNDIHDWVFDNSTALQRTKMTCWFDAENREVWWTFPYGNADEPSHYVMVNIDDWYWSSGELDRVGATEFQGKPLLADASGYIYEHEIGIDGNGVAIRCFLRSGDYRIEGAETNFDIMGFSPDFQRLEGTWDFVAYGKDRPQSSDVDQETSQIDNTTEVADIRVAGRYFSFSIENEEIGGDMKMGIPVLLTQEAGERP